MSRPHAHKSSALTADGAENSSTEFTSAPHKRRRQTNQALEALGHLIKDLSDSDDNSKLNKNDILSLTLARLLRQKYWPSNVFNKNVELASGIKSASLANDLNGFVIVFNTTGRIILMNDNTEYYLRKNVRLLYPQLTNIYNCVSKDDHDSIHRLLSNTTDIEQQIICTWQLPRGKRPNRNHTETKPMLMTGRFFSINNEENTKQCEKLFIARCEQILSSLPSIPTNSVGSTSATTFRFVLTDQLNIREISSNTESLLGYKAEELINQSMNRILASEHIQLLEQARQNCVLGRHYAMMNVLDLYTRDGDRLTFLCNTHMFIEGRRKAIKLGFLAQLIDPLATYEFCLYANKQNLERIRSAVQSEFMLSATINSNNFATTNILLTKDEEYLNLNNISSVYPATTLPHRRKRRRTSQYIVKSEPRDFFDKAKESPQFINYSYEPHISSSESLPSSASPMQEVGYIDAPSPYIDDKCELQDIKLIPDFPSFEDINEVLGLNNELQCCLLTPTIRSIGFF